MSKEMKPSSLWLLSYLNDRYPLGITKSHSFHENPHYVSLLTLVGLVKRGYVKKDKRIYIITNAGIERIKNKQNHENINN